MNHAVVLERKRLAKRQEAHRKDVINSETNYRYERKQDGGLERGMDVIQIHKFYNTLLKCLYNYK